MKQPQTWQVTLSVTDCLWNLGQITHLPHRTMEQDCLRRLNPQIPASLSFKCYFCTIPDSFGSADISLPKPCTSFSSAPLTAQFDTFHILKVLWEIKRNEDFLPTQGCHKHQASEPAPLTSDIFVAALHCFSKGCGEYDLPQSLLQSCGQPAGQGWQSQPHKARDALSPSIPH